MKFPFSKKKSDENLSRREIAARRRTENYEDLPAQSYRRNRTLNSRQTSSPLETSERLETHELVKKTSPCNAENVCDCGKSACCDIPFVSIDNQYFNPNSRHKKLQ